MTRAVATLVAGLACLYFAPSARAYSLGSGISTSCHEVITFEGLALALGLVDTSALPLPKDDSWARIARAVATALAESNPDMELPEDLTRQDLFLLWSLVVGVRSVDVEGHSVTDLTILRQIQADPSPEGQYQHALRGRADDGLAGDVAAIEGAKRSIRATLEEARAARDEPPITRVRFYLDFYGDQEVEVLRTMFLIGRAVHTLQDSYAHALRSADGRTILHVSNYLEAIEGTLQEDRDGLAHSASMDDCTGPIETLVDAASAASLAFIAAAVSYVVRDDPTLLDAGLSACEPGETDSFACGWLTYKPDCERALAEQDQAAQRRACCTGDNDYCETPWLPVFRERQSEPYVKAILGCSVTGPAPGRDGDTRALWVLLFAAMWRRGRRQRRAPGPVVSLLAPGVLLAPVAPASGQASETARPYPRPPLARAPLFVAVEGHLSLFTDVPRNSVVTVTTGYGLRGGYRFGDFGVLLHVERNHWLPTEFYSSLEPGALNVGVGGEYWYADGFARTSLIVGPSILMFDTPLHDAGRVGIYLDLRPIGLRYRVYDQIAVVFDPLTVAYVQPVLGDEHDIRQLEYRTDLSMELEF